MYEVNSGPKRVAIKTVIYGAEGIGKSTLASQFPNPLYIDTEGSTNHMNVNRLKAPQSFTELLSMIKWVANTRPCSTLVIDTVDWAEKLGEQEVLAERNLKGMEDEGYGRAYQYLHEKIGRLLDGLTEVIESGINVVLLAHAKIVKFEDPGEMGAYDRWELKLRSTGKTNNSALVKEWADMVLFLNYKVISVKDGGDMSKTFKGQGGQRTMYTTHRPAWDAKNRHGLPDEVQMDFASIAHIIPDLIGQQQVYQQQPQQQPVPQQNQQTPPPTPEPPVDQEPPHQHQYMPPQGAQQAPQLDESDMPWNQQPATQAQVDSPGEYPDYLPASLVGMMQADGITVDELRGAIGLFGHFPINTPLEVVVQTENYIDGGIIPAWENVKAKVDSIRHDRSQLVEVYQRAGDENAEQTVASLNIK